LKTQVKLFKTENSNQSQIYSNFIEENQKLMQVINSLAQKNVQLNEEISQFLQNKQSRTTTYQILEDSFSNQITATPQPTEINNQLKQEITQPKENLSLSASYTHSLNLKIKHDKEKTQNNIELFILYQKKFQINPKLFVYFLNFKKPLFPKRN
jgi:hypothetical protein